MLENICQVLSKYVVLRIMKPIELGVRNYQKGKILKYMSQIFSLQTKLNTTIGIITVEPLEGEGGNPKVG